MLERVVSVGQTGAEQAGWRAARACGIATGGWIPRGFLTEDGPRPELADRYGAREMPTSSYPERTFANARDSDATLWFGSIDAPGVRATIEACRQLSQSCLRVEDRVHPAVARRRVDRRAQDPRAKRRRQPGVEGAGHRRPRRAVPGRRAPPAGARTDLTTPLPCPAGRGRPRAHRPARSGAAARAARPAPVRGTCADSSTQAAGSPPITSSGDFTPSASANSSRPRP
jgi:hypothetical protein